MTYAEEIERLARALAELIGRDATARDADQTQPEVAWAVRDMVADRITEMTRALVDARVHGADFPARHLTTDPGHALHAALRDLPRLGGPEPMLAFDVLNHDAEGSAPWRAAVGASVALEQYTDHMRSIPGLQAWMAVRDLGDLATALEPLDADLRQRHGDLAFDHGTYGAIRLAASEIATRLPPLPNDLDITVAVPLRGVPLHGVTDLPDATARLASLIEQRGGDISAVEIRAAAMALSRGAEVTSVILRSAPGASATEAGRSLDQAATALTSLVATATATLSKPQFPIRYLAGEISNQFKVLEALPARVELLEDPAIRLNGRGRIVELATDWVPQASHATAALDQALRASHAGRRLLGRSEDDSSLVWVTTFSRSEPRAVVLVAEARAAMHDVHARLRAHSAEVPERAPAVRAALALDDLTAIRHRRALPQSAPLTAHPAVRAGASRIRRHATVQAEFPRPSAPSR